MVGCGVLAAAAIATGSVALAGFGVDSAIEILASAVVVWQLKGTGGDGRQRTALRTIAVAFALLVVYIGIQSARTFLSDAHPGTSAVGIAWLAVTVIAMLALAAGKHDAGRRLHNPVLSTEARVTLIDAALAAAVLLGICLNAAAGWWWADPLAALVILFYGAREARHAWQASRLPEHASSGCGSCSAIVLPRRQGLRHDCRASTLGGWLRWF